jgi:hypothetical protein
MTTDTEGSSGADLGFDDDEFSLAEVESGSSEIVIAFTPEELRAKLAPFAGLTYATDEGKIALRKVVRLRTSIDKRRKQLNEADQGKINSRNEAAKLLQFEIAKVEDPLQAAKKIETDAKKEAEAKAERERLEAVAAREREERAAKEAEIKREQEANRAEREKLDQERAALQSERDELARLRRAEDDRKAKEVADEITARARAEEQERARVAAEEVRQARAAARDRLESEAPAVRAMARKIITWVENMATMIGELKQPETREFAESTRLELLTIAQRCASYNKPTGNE